MADLFAVLAICAILVGASVALLRFRDINVSEQTSRGSLEPLPVPMTPSARMWRRLVSVLRSPWSLAGLVSFAIGLTLSLWMGSAPSEFVFAIGTLAFFFLVPPIIGFLGVFAHLGNALSVDPNSAEEPWYVGIVLQEPAPAPAPRIPTGLEEGFESLAALVGCLAQLLGGILVLGGIAGLLLIGWRALLG